VPNLGETVRILASITDYDGEAMNPDTQEVKVYDPSGALKHTETAPTKKADGLYYISYTFPGDGAIGNWTVNWKIVKWNAVRTRRLTIPVTAD